MQFFLVTDLDGTLADSPNAVPTANVQRLRELSQRGVVRVVATGRSLWGVNKALSPDFPVDYVIFGSGAGIMDWKKQSLMRSCNLSPEQALRGIAALKGMRLDFMVLDPIPESHKMQFWASGRSNPDFEKRRLRFAGLCQPLNGVHSGLASELLVIEPPATAPKVEQELRVKLHDLSLVHATSPLDGDSSWFELFAPEVSKGRAAAWLAGQLGIGNDHTLAVGNDYNDLDLLRWAKLSFVVKNSPEVLREEFTTVSSVEQGGFLEATDIWMKRS